MMLNKMKLFKYATLAILLFAFVVSSIYVYKQEQRRGISFVTTNHIKVPSLDGYADTTSLSYDIIMFFEQLTPPTNELVTVYIPQEDLDLLLAGKQQGFSKYMTVQLLKGNEKINLGEFKQVKDLVRNNI